MTEPSSPLTAPAVLAAFAPPPAMPSILASAVGETRRAVAMLLSRA